MKFKNFKRILAFLLVLCMMVGLVPMSAMPVNAEETSTVANATGSSEVVDAAIIFTDLHTNKSNYKDSTIQEIFGALRATNLPFSSVTSGGDAFSVNEDSSSSNGPYAGYTQTISTYIRNALGNTSIPVNYVWSDHDRYAYQENSTDTTSDDTTLLDKTSHLTYGAGKDGVYGTDDDGNYYVYALSMGDLSSFDRYNAGFSSNRTQNGFTESIEKAIENFVADASKLKKDRPLFIVSHQPLFDRRNDNAFAEQWFDAINTVAAEMDVAFFFGHNHKHDVSTDYYYEKGSQMPVATKDKWNNYAVNSSSSGVDLSSETKSLNFTHMCAGYMEPTSTGSYSQSGTRRNVAVAVTIYDDSIRYTTYDKNGVYTGSYAIDKTVLREHVGEQTTPTPEDNTTVPEGYTLDRIEVVNQGVTKYYFGEALNKEGLSVVAVYTKADAVDVRINLKEASDSEEGYTVSGYDANKVGKQYITVSYEECIGSYAVEVFQKTFTDETGNVSIEFGNTGITAVKVTSKEKTVEGYKAYVTYDITPTGYTEGDEATVTVKVDTSLFDVTLPVSVLDQGKCIATTNIVDGKITFTTNHFSEYDVVQVSLDNADWKPLPGGKAYTYTLDTDGVNNNNKYLIASGNSDVVSLMTNLQDGTDNTGSTSATVVNADGKTTITLADDSKVAWVISSDKNGTISNNGKYFYLSDKNYDSNNILTSGKDKLVNITKNNDGSYEIKRNNYGHYLAYTNNGWVSKNSSGKVYLFVYAGEKEVAGGYVTLVGQNSFTISMDTMSVTQIEEMIRGGIHVYTASDVNESNLTEKTDYTLTGSVVPSTEGTYTYSVKYENIELGTINVNVVDKVAESISVNPTTFIIERDTAANTVIGTITVKYSPTNTEVATTETVPLTIEMLGGTFNREKNGIYSDLSVSYGGKKVEGLTLNVVNKTGVNDFPQYPNPGSVDLEKTAKGVDFQNTGVARVELSASGLPAGGVDVIIMLDTSSSMQRNCINGDSVNSGVISCHDSRAEVLEASLDKLIEQFRTAGPGKTPLDVRVAIANFNGYYRPNRPNNGDKTPYDVDANDKVGSDNGNQDPSANPVKTGSGNPDETAFVPITSQTLDTLTLDYTSGTNYDYAFDAIYQMGSAIKSANGTNQRPLYVIFMSDGIPFQWNYYTSNRDQKEWNNWLTGSYKTLEEVKAVTNNDAHSYFYNLEDTDNDGYLNEHRMANAIKGNTNRRYEIIRKATTGYSDIQQVAGKDDLYTVPGLGANMFAINFAAKKENEVTLETVKHAISSIASKPTDDTQYYYEANSADDLDNAFDIIGKKISYAATDARFIDQMGSSFNLQMNPTIKTNNSDNKEGFTTTTTDITITTHPVYTEDQLNKNVDGHVVKKEDIGKTYGNGTLVEKVTFTVNNNIITATSNVGGYKIPNGTGTGTVTVTALETNILVDGIIYGKNFFYNSNTTSKQITLANGSTVELPAETFYWNIGTINEVQYTMSYTVYLDGSLEGLVSAGSYDTNNFATLYYTNWVGNDVNQSVASPALAWKGAQVSYAFYLVDDNGKPVHADGTEASNFLQAYKITQPVLYKNVELNKTGGTVLDAAGLAVLPQGYVLYAPDAEYVVTIASGDGDGANNNGWTITGDAKKTTYVVGYGNTNDYNNTQIVTTDHTDTENYKEIYGSYDYTHTTVYFAVKWIIGTVPDTVVIDYGLDVEVNVLANDMFGTDGTLAGVGTVEAKPGGHGSTMANGFGSSLADSVGTATVIGNKVRYSLNKNNSMKLNDERVLAYAVDYDGASNPGYYYGDLTIIPATTVYYEDEYVTLTTFNRPDTTTTDYTKTQGWPVDSVNASTIQGEDRPGQFNLSTIDANNVYGYDAAYSNMSTFSMDNAAMIHVDAKQYGTAEFEFYGTGFDVVSATSNTTGTLNVKVYECDEQGNPTNTLATSSTTGSTTGKKVSKAVDTYYGYVYGLYDVVYEKGEDGLWTKISVGDEKPEGTKEQTKEDLPKDAAAGTTATITHYTWKAVNNAPNALYQVPVMKVDGLKYGKYKVVISALYYSSYDSTTEPGYDLYLDAIRIYNPAGTTDAELGETIKNAYEADGEYNPNYFELRNLLIKAATIKNLSNSEAAEGIVFIDGNTLLDNDTAISGSAVEDYTNYGPNNELYLAPGQAVAFNLYTPSMEGYDTVVRIGMKTVGNKTAKAELWTVGPKAADGNYVKYNTISQTINTATDMYYDISVLNNGNVVVTNTGEEGSVLSITNIKTSYRPIVTSTAGLSEVLQVANEEEQTMFFVTRASVDAAMMTLVRPQVEEPDVNEPEIDEPEVDEPEVNEPEKFTPEKFEVSVDKKDVKVDQKVKVKVKTSADVEYVTVNGEQITKCKTDKKTGQKEWTLDIKANEAGEMLVEVVAYDVNDVASDVITNTVSVTEKAAANKPADKKPTNDKPGKK